MRTLASLLTLVVSAALLAMSSPALAQSKGSDLLVKLESDFQKATAEKGWDGYVTFFADDGVSLPNGGSIVQGREAIRKELGEWTPGSSLTWKPSKAEMAASGDIGYTYGEFTFKTKDKEGHPVVRYGKYATIWKKQKDGSWKVAMDMGNTAPPHEAQ
jgi:ketosteroid isomerase-like protein